MKIVIIKKTTKTVKPLGECGFLYDDGGLLRPGK
jgi:hypothetical protein